MLWYRHLAACLTLLSGLAAFAVAHAAPEIRVDFIGAAVLARLSEGAPGDGTLLYYLGQRAPDRPSLVVRLSKSPGADVATAVVYEAPAGSDHIPVVINGSSVTFSRALTPALTIRALGGWWVRDGKVNYNLDIQIDMPSYSMWGASYDPKFGLGGWAAQVSPGTHVVDVMVRDPEGVGVPRWDLRQLLPPFPGQGDYRTNYVERMCDTPLKHDFGVSPEWPFVAISGGFEQPVGTLRPPIVVDWATGKITAFSELVTARNQNCSYTVYSLRPLEIGVLNKPDFETPFAFYDLSGKGAGFPDLILRTEHYPAGDQWSAGLDPKVQRGVPVQQDFETVRYSWSDEVGNGTWDYKVEVMGNHPYTSGTSIAGGLATIMAPSYGAFPKWVIDRKWPVVTFVATEGSKYRSSEGIYDWSPREVGARYFLGEDANVASGAFTSIREGLRGEYRFGEPKRPALYFSPIDKRLHLLGADGGRFNLGHGWVLRLGNLTGGPYLDIWELDRSNATGGNDSKAKVSGGGPAVPMGAQTGRLLKLGQLLIYSSGHGLTVKRIGARDASFVTQPPTDHASWVALRKALAPFQGARRDPFDMKGWLAALSGPELALDGVSLSNVQPAADGHTVRFELTVAQGAHASGALGLPVFSDLAPGRYVVTYDQRDQRWHRQPATAPEVRATFQSTPLQAFEPARVTLTLTNRGTLDWRGDLTLRAGGETVRSWNGVVVPGGGSTTEEIAWTPVTARQLPAAVSLAGRDLPLPDIHVSATPRTLGVQSFRLSVNGGARVPLLALFLGLFVLSGALGVWMVWRRS